jgi:hypothetical protein
MSSNAIFVGRRALLRSLLLVFAGVCTPATGVQALTAGPPTPLPAQPMATPFSAGSSPELCTTCLDQPACARILHLLDTRPTTLMTVPDIAGCLALSSVEVQAGADRLFRMGLLRRVSVGALAFYGITDDAGKQKTVRRFRDWCDEQREHWAALQKVVG